MPEVRSTNTTSTPAPGRWMKFSREGGPSGQGSVSSGGQSGGGSTADIGEQAAQSAALSHAGSVKRSGVLRVKRDYDDGRLEYEVEFWAGTTEYEYKIDGTHRSCEGK